MKRKSDFKRRFARAYCHLEDVAEQFYYMMKCTEDRDDICNIMEEIAVAAVYLQDHIKHVWQMMWGPWPTNIESYR